MTNNFLVRCVFFLNRHYLWTCFGMFAALEGALGYLIFPRIINGTIDSPFHLYEEVIGGLVLIPILGTCACRFALELLTEAIMKPKIRAASEREKPKTLKTSQASDPRFEAAFERDTVEPRYSRAKFEQINEDRFGLLGRWKLYWRARRVLRKRHKQ